jgi:hypothetical protein
MQNKSEVNVRGTDEINVRPVSRLRIKTHGGHTCLKRKLPWQPMLRDLSEAV